jgi:hypothetical protein
MGLGPSAILEAMGALVHLDPGVEFRDPKAKCLKVGKLHK